MSKLNILNMIKSYWRAIAGIVGLAVIVAWSGGACSRKVAPGVVDVKIVAPPAGAEIIKVARESIPARMFVVGNVDSEEKIHLSARIPAYINEVKVTSGDEVKKGQVLVTLDDREFREQLAAGEAQLKQAETEYQRTKQLFEKNATTDQALTAAESMFNSARAQVDRIKVMLTYAQITSPIDGLVTERRIEAGDLANPGQMLLTVYDPLRMRLEVAVPVRLLDRLALNQNVEVSLERPAETIKGRITEIVSEVDPASRTQTVKIRLESEGKALLPGTFGRLWVDGEPHDGVRVPASAVYRVGQVELVQVVSGGRVMRRAVKTGSAFGDRIEILSGLSDGDEILAQPVKEG